MQLDLFNFVKLSEIDMKIQEELSNCHTSSDLEKILEKYQCEFTIKNIENLSRDLSASYWPWASKTKSYRKNFFQNK
tara:strand:+ start:291 stop:521 length:231 start_codon:yes stop_codon:yes gene_type:complete